MRSAKKVISPWVQDQRRIRRLRAKVRAQYDRAEFWMRTSNLGWVAARRLFQIAMPHMTQEERVEWKQYFENSNPSERILKTAERNRRFRHISTQYEIRAPNTATD